MKRTPIQISGSISILACDFRQLVEKRGTRKEFTDLIHRLDKLGHEVGDLEKK